MPRRAIVPKKTKCDTPEPPTIPEERYFLNPDDVSPHLYCSICQEVFCEPYRAPCGHSYCKQCIFSWLEKDKTCPEDRKSLHSISLHHDFIVENIINDYKVACPWRALGCEFVAPLHTLATHKKSCPLNPTNMPEILRSYSTEILQTASQQIMDRSIKSNLSALAAANAPKPLSSGSSTSPSTSQPSATSSITGSTLLDSLLLQAEAEETENANTGASDQASNAENASPHEERDNVPRLSSESASNAAVVLNDSDDDEPSHIPKANLPSLRMRLYMAGNEELRNGLCDFLSGTLTTNPSLLNLEATLAAGDRRRQGPAPKRPRNV